MFQNGQRICFRNGGDPARIQRVQLAYGKDRFRAPQVVPSNDPNATQVQIVTGEDAARYPFIDPIGIVGAPAAWFRADTGVTVTGLGASTWADQSGNGRDLLQGTDANRPPYLSYSASSGKYLYLPGVNGNNATTPDTAGNSFSGDVDLRVRVALDDWTPSATQTFLAKWLNGQRAYVLQINTSGSLIFAYTTDGATTTGRVATSSVATSIADKAASWIRATYASATGKVNFYKADDSGSVPSSWTAIGTEQTITSGAIVNSNQTVMVGQSQDTGSEFPAAGKIYRALGYSTIGGTTPAFDFNPDLDGSDQAASFTSSATGEVWTINKSASGLIANLVGSPWLIGNGTSHSMATGAFVLDQPCTIYSVGKDLTWTLNDYISDGAAKDSGALIQSATTPRFKVSAGSAIGENAGLAVGTLGVRCAVINGASSLTQVNLGTPVTGDAGAAQMDGITVFSSGAVVTGWWNGMMKEHVVFPTAHDATQRARVIAYLAGRHGIAL